MIWILLCRGMRSFSSTSNLSEAPTSFCKWLPILFLLREGAFPILRFTTNPEPRHESATHFYLSLLFFFFFFFWKAIIFFLRPSYSFPFFVPPRRPFSVIRKLWLDDLMIA